MDKKTLKFKLQSRRYYSEAFKKQKVNEIITKKATIRELSKIYDIAPKLLYEWVNKYTLVGKDKVKVVLEMESEAQKTLFYKERVAELERFLGQKQIEIEFLSKLIELASEELQVDIKKNFSTKLSNGSVSILKKPGLP